MNRMVVAAATVVVLFVCSAFLWSLHEAAAEDCSDTDAVVWRTIPVADAADANRYFSTQSLPGFSGGYLQLNWAFRETPFLGGAEWQESTSEHIASAQYDPAYFYPSSCIGSVGVVASGYLDTEQGTNGILKTKGWVWDSGNPAPYAEDTHTMTVYRS